MRKQGGIYIHRRDGETVGAGVGHKGRAGNHTGGEG